MQLEIYKKNSIFRFKEAPAGEIEKEIDKLSSKKPSQNSDITTAIIIENADIFAEFSCKSISATFKVELRSNYIFLYFNLIGLE